METGPENNAISLAATIYWIVVWPETCPLGLKLDTGMFRVYLIKLTSCAIYLNEPLRNLIYLAIVNPGSMIFLQMLVSTYASIVLKDVIANMGLMMVLQLTLKTDALT